MQSIAVFYLARIKEGFPAIEAFVHSYRKYPAGHPHDFYIIYKGEKKPGTIAAIEHIFSGIDYKIIYIDDDEGYDIHAYIKAAKQVPHDDICVFNTFTQLLTDNWLKKMADNYYKPNVGAVGATGSYESLYSSYKLISKAIWLFSGRIRYNKLFINYFKLYLKYHFPPFYFSSSLYRKIRRFLGNIKHQRGSVHKKNFNTEYKTHWESIINKDASLHFVTEFPQFPNPHLRSNGFLTAKKRFLEFDGLENDKISCCKFESGYNNLSAKILNSGLDLLIVGADGVGYSVLDWSKSKTFRLFNQENLLLSDNQTRQYSNMDRYERAFVTRITWGDYLSSDLTKKQKNTLHLDIDFPVNTQLSTLKNDFPQLKFSIVIPTHNRLSLLKDAIYTVLQHKNYDNWELIIFDNASSDSIEAYVQSLNEPRIRYKKSNDFLPVTKSWNNAIDMASGDYVMLIGDDDGLVPDYFTKLNTLIHAFEQPDFIYASIYQFMHPGVLPSMREGYLQLVKNGFFFTDKDNPFILSKKDADRTWQGSLLLKRNFGLGLQQFIFKRTFLESLRINGAIFHSTYPDYYLANLAMAKGNKIVVSPKPFACTGVSTASFGYTLFNNLQQTGEIILNSPLTNDDLYPNYKSHLLPGSSYQDNYLVTMGHIAKNISTQYYLASGIQRYRKLQIFSFISKQTCARWMISSVGKSFWSKLKSFEKIWALWITFYHRMGKIQKVKISETACPATQIHISTGEFANLRQIYDMLEDRPND